MNNQSSIDILAMFIISTLHNSRDQSHRNTMIQVELEIVEQNSKSYDSVQSMSVT